MREDYRERFRILGLRIAYYRKMRGMTQEQFAEALQVSRQAVSRWESGRSYPEVDKILYICNRYAGA